MIAQIFDKDILEVLTIFSISPGSKFLRKEFGSLFGEFAYRVWKVPFLRSLTQDVGMLTWKTLRKLRRNPLQDSWSTH